MPHLLVDTLKNGDKVRIYYTLLGNPKGIPAVYLHGGPGDSITPLFKKQYDLKLYRVLLFDQRGCGKSEPHNHLEKNTTHHLLADMEKLRKLMQVDRWIVSGGSWGTALAFLYAIKHPNRTLGLILRGVFDFDIDNTVIKSIYPEDEANIKKLVPAKTSKDFYFKTTRILKNKKNKTRKKLIELLSKPDPMYVYTTPKKDSFDVQESLAIIGTHYERNRYFVPSDSIYKGLHRIEHIPIIMIEGRYDIVTPMKMAYKLSKRLPLSELRVVKAGHTLNEPATLTAFHQASQDMAKKLRP
jgi:proline iminopeptidase